MNIACCIDDPVFGAKLADRLATEGFDCEMFDHEAAVLRALRHRRAIDLALFELGSDPAIEQGLPSWFDSHCEDHVPVMLVYSGWTAQRVALALEAGADDCIAKPVDVIELVARIKAILRRCRLPRRVIARAELAGFALDK